MDNMKTYFGEILGHEETPVELYNLNLTNSISFY